MYGDFDALDKRYVRLESSEYQGIVAGMRDVKEIRMALLGGLNDEGKYMMGFFSWIKVATIVGGTFVTILIGIITAVAATYIERGH
jgi:hypothetical protein